LLFGPLSLLLLSEREEAREGERGGDKRRKGGDGRQVAGRRRTRGIHKPRRISFPSITSITFFGG
jgi:hypothetical protein